MSTALSTFFSSDGMGHATLDVYPEVGFGLTVAGGPAWELGEPLTPDYGPTHPYFSAPQYRFAPGVMARGAVISDGVGRPMERLLELGIQPAVVELRSTWQFGTVVGYRISSTNSGWMVGAEAGVRPWRLSPRYFDQDIYCNVSATVLPSAFEESWHVALGFGTPF